MNVADTLEALRNKAMRDPALKKALIETRNHPNSLREFCRISTEAGLPIYDMDIIEYGEFAYAAMRRSTNGGGENSPLLDGEDVWKRASFCNIMSEIQIQRQIWLPVSVAMTWVMAMIGRSSSSEFLWR